MFSFKSEKICNNINRNNLETNIQEYRNIAINNVNSLMNKLKEKSNKHSKK